MSARIWETAEEVLAEHPPVPVDLFDDWWNKATPGNGMGTVAARGKNALVTCGDYLGTFSWSAVLQALNENLRLPIHKLGYLKELAANPAKKTTIKFLRGPRES